MLINKLPRFNYLPDEGIELIHEKSLVVLEKHGLEFTHPEAVAALEAAGAEVADRDTGLVRLPRELVLQSIAKAPASFPMQARNPAHDVIIGGDHMVLAPMYGSPFVHDLETGKRRDASLADFQNFARLACMTPQIHNTGGTLVEPEDTDLDTRHLDMVYSLIKYSDKTFMGSVTSAANARDTVELAAILFGGHKAIRQKPAVISVINVNSPRRYDTRMLESMLEYVKAGQPVLVTPFSSAGAMSPAAMGGTLVQVNAEVLAGVTLAQVVNPGAPVVYGAFLMITDMQSGSPALGTPETAAGHFVNAQLARRYNLPYRAGGVLNCSKLPDAQAFFEGMMSLWPTYLAGTNFVLHAAGWLEAGLVASFEKFVIDVELLRMMERFLDGIALDDEGLAMDTLDEVGPGGHFFGAAHTLRHYKTAFYRPIISDLMAYERWQQKGAKTAVQRANELCKKWLAAYEEPALDPGIDEGLRDYIARRKEAIKAEVPDY